ncbi:MAG TPA: two-component regulator propeller domain-containing protein [Candidatus Acidoferrales bacterium]|nr:two-component regulator propeller domain-containing protein [Candidatus Acidoferrales bacterium]
MTDNALMPALTHTWTRSLTVFCLGICFLLCAFPQKADSDTPPNDYLIKTWDTEENLSGSTVTAIVQTPDGYLWVGTYEGLTRFDGVHSVTFDSLNKPALSHSRIQGLYLDARGTLWINTYRGGLTSYRDGVFRREWPDQADFDLHTTMVSSSSNQVTFVTQFGEIMKGALDGTNTNWTVLRPPGNTRPNFQCVDESGTLWFLSREGRILRVLDGQYTELPSDCGLADTRVLTLTSDANGRVWAGAVNEIARWNGHAFEDFTPTNLDTSTEFDPVTLFPASNGALWVLANDRLRMEVGRRWAAEADDWRGLLGSASNRAMGVHEDQNGGIWFNHYGNGVFYITPSGRFKRFTVRNGLPGDRVGAWFQDRDGGIWLGVDRGGLVRMSTRHFQLIGQVEGLPVWPALSVCQDAGHTVWIGTAGGGLGCYKDGNLVTSGAGGAAATNFIFSIFPESNGNLWLSAGDGEDLFQFHNGRIQRSSRGIHGVKSLLVDRAGRLWVGTKINVGWYTEISRGRVFGAADDVADSPMRALAEAPDGTVWSGADDGTLYHCETNRVQKFQPSDAMGARPIWSLLVDPDGTVWAGTFRGGLLRFRDGKFTRFSTKQGMPDVISQILEDRHARLWLGTHQGICCVEIAALDACAAGIFKTVDAIRHVGGLPTLVCSDGYQPACWQADNGHLLFTTVKGVVSVDPEKLAATSLPPPVAIEDLLVDGQAVPLRDQKIVIPPGHEQFEFQFSALCFEAPEQSRFRYRIDGLDKGCVEADTRRVADYDHLPPNDYRFHVIACNSDGVWNKTGASLEFTVLPYFYQTRWFIVLISALVLIGVGLTVRHIATRNYRRALLRLEQQHAIEKDRARIAKDIHDDIGAGLTQITLLSELGRREPKQSGAQLERISDAARDLTRAMDEIVWAVDPQRDTLVSLIDYISAYSEDFLRSAGIRCRMDFPAAVPAMQIDAEFRYNLFLALKETLNNIVKHAQATEVRLRLRLTPGVFTLAVEDNGHGFETNNGGKSSVSVDRINSGLGLPNLRKRLEAIGGRCVMESSHGNGTRVEMTIHLNGATSSVMAIGGNGLEK